MQRITATDSTPLHGIAATRTAEQTAAAGLAPHTLMQRAGLAVARLARALAPHSQTIWIACGPGNNGGDGLEAAMHLQQWGLHPVVTLLGERQALPADARASLQRAEEAGVTFSSQPPALTTQDLCIDALLGIGASRAASGLMRALIRQINASPAPTLSVDLPSGLQADTGTPLEGDAEAVIQARHTLSLLALKPGLFTAWGRDFSGEVWLDDLGVSPDLGEACASLNPLPSVRQRPHASHKGSHGDVLVLGGEGLARRGMGMTGAALLAASAALHGGAGRVLVCLLDGTGLPLDPAQPELMLRSLEAVGQMDSPGLTVVCGCGGGLAVQKPLARALTYSPRLVLDADALNAVAQHPPWRTALADRATRGWQTILTPHPLEAARLLGSTSQDVQADRLAAARQLAREFQSVVVLKGSGTVIAAPGHLPAVNTTGNARLATAGTGDVLAGLIGAHLAAGAGAWQAACTAVAQHGALADAWPAEQALTASALARQLRPWF